MKRVGINQVSDTRQPRSALGRFRTLPGATILMYVVLIWAAILIPDHALRWSLNQLLPSWSDYSGVRRQPSLYAKIAQYRAEGDRYDLIFTGDSRTYAGIAPDEVDARMGTHSINLATWGNWFSTQYASNQDLLPMIPSGVPVVWSIGHVNFQKTNESINFRYAIPFVDVPRFLSWGYTPRQLGPNLLESIPGLALYTRRAYIREHLDRLFSRVLWRSSAPAEPPRAKSPYDDLLAALAADPEVLDTDVLRSEGEVTSLAVFKRSGNYVRFELDPAFFREKQRELADEIETMESDRFEPDPNLWKNFLEILDQYEQHGVRLIVNEFEEAPYHYKNPKNRRLYREFMQGVRQTIEGRGIPYIRVDFSRLGDEHYFDFNHLNNEGIEIFTAMFAEKLAPFVEGG